MGSNSGPDEKQQWALIGRYGTIGIEMGLCVTFGLLGGQWIDRRFGTAPYGMNIGLGMGVIAAFKALWRMYRTIEADENRARAEKQTDDIER
jgi:ATP synthase protein I